MNNRNFIIVMIVLLAAGIISVFSYLPSKPGSLEPQMANFPLVIGQWQGVDIPISERDYQILETRNLIIREYKNRGGESVYLYIIYSSDSRRAIHPPEICYTGGGATILEKSIVPVTESITANSFVIEDRDSRQLVVYWFKSPGLSTYSYLKQQIKVVFDRIFSKKTSGAMVRVSTVVKGDSQNDALGLIRAFCFEIEPLLTKYAP